MHPPERNAAHAGNAFILGAVEDAGRMAAIYARSRVAAKLLRSSATIRHVMRDGREKAGIWRVSRYMPRGVFALIAVAKQISQVSPAARRRRRATVLATGRDGPSHDSKDTRASDDRHGVDKSPEIVNRVVHVKTAVWHCPPASRRPARRGSAFTRACRHEQFRRYPAYAFVCRRADEECRPHPRVRCRHSGR